MTPPRLTYGPLSINTQSILSLCGAVGMCLLCSLVEGSEMHTNASSVATYSATKALSKSVCLMTSILVCFQQSPHGVQTTLSSCLYLSKGLNSHSALFWKLMERENWNYINHLLLEQKVLCFLPVWNINCCESVWLHFSAIFFLSALCKNSL